MDYQLEINQLLNDRIEYLERKVFDLIETVNVLTEAHNSIVNAVRAAREVTEPGISGHEETRTDQ